MRGRRSATRDYHSELNYIADWVAADYHFGAPRNTVTRELLPSPPLQGRLPEDLRSVQPISVPSPYTQVPNPRTTADASTQTDTEAATAVSQPQLPGEILRRGAPTFASPTSTAVKTPVPTTAPTEPGTASDPPSIASVEATTPSAEPANTSSTDPGTPPVAPATVSADATAGPAAPSTPAAEPPTSLVVGAGTVREPSRSRPSSGNPRTRSQVGRDSYQLLWREYLAITEQPQQQQAASTRGRQFLGGVSSTTRSNSATAGRATDMSAPAPSSVMQGPLPYDKPKGLSALLLPLLCPPTDSIDVQKLTKLLVRIVVALSSWLVTLSFAVIPAWLWLLRHELLHGHTCNAATLLVVGLVVFVAADAVRGLAARADGARRAGTFKANDKSAYQLSPGRQGVAGARAAAAPGAAAGAAGQATAITGGTAPGGSRTPSAAARSHPPGPASGVDPLVSQVKQRIIKLEKFLFGNELTEADISRDALGSRVHMLCTEVGVPFGGPGGSSTRPGTAELDQQLRAVESALGVM